MGDLAADGVRGGGPQAAQPPGGDRDAADGGAGLGLPAAGRPPADDPCRPVFRFDVTGAQWTHVQPAGQETARIPAMTAQGSTDGGTTWQDLGQLMPSTAPAADRDGTLTLGPASFYFQNRAGTAVAPGV